MTPKGRKIAKSMNASAKDSGQKGDSPSDKAGLPPWMKRFKKQG